MIHRQENILVLAKQVTLMKVQRTKSKLQCVPQKSKASCLRKRQTKEQKQEDLYIG